METTPVLRKNHRALRRMLICISAAAILVVVLLTWLGTNMRSAMTALATARIRSVAAKAMNDAILDTMQQDENYTELLHIRENGSKVYMVHADPRQMNLLSAQCAEAAQQRIAALGEQGIAIPLGTITGISFLSGKGPAIQLVMPGIYELIRVSTEAAIAENIIAGEVPQVYTNVASEEDMLNLIPTDLP